MAALGIVTLLTDFGLSDTYVGQMKGVILSRFPRAVLVDLTHAVRPQAVEQGAFLLESAVEAFPPGTVHLAVVDPGVGSARRALAIAAGGRLFVGPDNGLLSAALREGERPAGRPGPVALPPEIQAIELTDPRFRAADVSATFHGRDLFAPAAAHLASGGDIRELGPPLRGMIAFPPFRAESLADGHLRARVVHIDHFGNLITTCRAADLLHQKVVVRHARHTTTGLFRTYTEAPVGELVALAGSGGYIELAVRDGNAAERTGIRIGDEVVVAPAP